ncbi:hypothetical protein [Undibacterium sp. TJN19]|uniref:hypothetical protein n=1 Tax=Undibacterium sp. TJN19 TaxID=3413055 RepID=UPI003BF06670
MLHRDAIQLGFKNENPLDQIARKIYVTYPSFVFEKNFELKFEIFNEIANRWNIPINQILITGSAHTGESFHKANQFTSGESDLDVAIISERLFLEYLDYACKATNGYKDLSKFERRDGKSVYDGFVNNLARGFFRPDLMPLCQARTSWFDFFQKISQKHLAKFKSINAGIYSTLQTFEYKQIENINNAKQLIGKK